MATIGPRKKIDIEVSEVELSCIIKALNYAIDICDYSEERAFRMLLADFEGGDKCLG